MGENEILTTISFGGLIHYLMKFLKTRDWYTKFVTAVPMADRWIYRIVAGLGSLAAALGIVWTTSGDSATGWMITVAIPGVNVMMDAAWKWVQVFLTQQYMYDSTRRPAAMPHDLKAGS